VTRYRSGMRYALLVLVAACGPAQHGGTAPYPEPSVADIVARLQKAHDATKSFRADATMDFWLGNQRTKGEVLVMSKATAFARFAALSPAGGSTMAEMACNGRDFVYVDYQRNCQVAGPCDRSSIARFFGVELEPDDFLHLAVGTPPVLPNATGTATWNSKTGLEDVALASGGKTEKLSIDMKNGKLDVVEASMTDGGKLEWGVKNSDFIDVGGYRVPQRSHFTAPGTQQDLEVDWGDAQNRGVNVAIEDSKFALAAPSGLGACQAAQAATASPRPPHP
jgi:hypothetical protein